MSVAVRAAVNACQPWGIRCYVAHDAVIHRAALPVDGPVLIMVPLRLGLDVINPVYVDLLQALLRCSFCCGIIGGTEKSSLYFCGYQGAQVFYMDPHTVLPQLTEAFQLRALEDFRRAPLAMPFVSIDPSLAVGFYCHDAAQLDQLKLYLEAETSHMPYWIAVQDGPVPDSLSSSAGDVVESGFFAPALDPPPRLLKIASAPLRGRSAGRLDARNAGTGTDLTDKPVSDPSPRAEAEAIADDWVAL